MAHNLRVNGIVEESIVDGPGLRYVVFTQGCPHHCFGCHNPDTHSLDGGFLIATRTLIQQYRENPLLSGITFSGGEPFLQAAPLCEVAEKIHSLGGTVVTYTGYTFEQLYGMGQYSDSVRTLLSLTDILVDGPFVEALRDAESLRFRGSSNQRVLQQEDMAHLAAKSLSFFSQQDNHRERQSHGSQHASS